ncbi:unnamed protein product [Discula destructiva]
MSSLPPVETYRKLLKRINSNQFLNRELVNICRINSLSSQGVKAQLQKTITDALTEAYSKNNVSGYRVLEESIRREKDGLSSPAPQTYSAQQLAQNAPLVHATPSALPSINNMANHGYAPVPGIHPSYGGPYANNLSGGMSGHRSYQAAPPGPTFHRSPFYEVIQRVGHVHLCQAMSQHRNSITINLKAQDTALLKRCIDDKTLRVMVFCGAEEHGVQDIAFPHQSEMKVNGDDVKANLRGLKNKPGSTRPVDITDLLRLRIPAYSNTIDFTYALTKNKFWLVINLCKSVPVEELVNEVSKRKISKASVIQELTKQAHDEEIQLASQVLSLKCPISYMRLITPVRASTCTHVQCFDATSYLQLQQQGPQWICPICSKSAPFDRLAIDEYVHDILDRTSKSVEQVDIQPDGEWMDHKPVETQQVKPDPRYEEAFNVDDDELDTSEVSFASGRKLATPADPGTSRTNFPAIYGVPTPSSGASREGSSMPRSGGAAKRTHEVIDLTLSDDDDELPPPKRQQFNRPGAGYQPYY